MNLDDTIPEEARPWGSAAHLEWRKQMRLEKKMNKAHGKKKPLLKSLPPSLRILRHELDCDCMECEPQHVKDFLKTTSWANGNPNIDQKPFDVRPSKCE